MGVENKFIQFMRNAGPAKFFIPFGIVLIVFGIVMSGFKTGDYVETVGKVTSVIEGTYDEETHDRDYDVYFTYTANDKEYESYFVLSGDYKEGDEIKVFYNPENPEQISNSKADWLPYVLIGVGAVTTVFGVFKAVQTLRRIR